jgi:DNA-binding NtrC family response regulator
MGLPIELPPLRERGNDILLLAKYFLDEFTRNNKLQPIQLSAGAREKLLGYNFPGNVRELKALMDLAAVMCANGEISPDDITFTSTRGEDAFMATEKSLREHTCDIIQFYLNKYDKDVLLVAKKLDVGKSTLYRMIQAGEVHIS